MIHQNIRASSPELEAFLFDLRERLCGEDVEVVDAFEHLHPDHHAGVPRTRKDDPPHVGWLFTQRIDTSAYPAQFLVVPFREGMALFSSSHGNYSFNGSETEVRGRGALDTKEIEFLCGLDFRREWYVMYKKARMRAFELQQQKREEITGKALMLWIEIKKA